MRPLYGLCTLTHCHNPVSFSLQILQVINELQDLTTIFLILSYHPHSLPSHYLIKGKDDIIFKTYTRQHKDIYSSGLEPWNSSRLISHISSSVSVSSSPSLPPSSHSGHWGTFRVGICQEYVPTRLNNPTLIRPGKSLDYRPYIQDFRKIS